MSYFYSVFGLRLHSNLSIPGFQPIPPDLPYDVEVSLGTLPEWLDRTLPPDSLASYVSPYRGAHNAPCSRMWRAKGDYFRIVYDEGTDCLVDRGGTHVWIWWPSPYTVADVVPYLQGQLLGLVQRLRGVTCLHASSISIGDQAIAVTGGGGSGKSTTAAAFLQRGFAILADDVTPIFEQAGSFMVRPAHSRLWLLPDMVETLYGSTTALPLLAPSWEKRFVDLHETTPGFPHQPSKLAAVYVLLERSDEPNRPEIALASPRQALLHLISNTYINHLLDSHMRAQEFVTLGRLLQTVPVLEVRPHTDPARIPMLCNAIRADAAERVSALMRSS